MKRLLLLLGLIFLFEASAQPIKEISFEDLDGDGRVELAKIKTQILSPSDIVLVYDTGNNMKEVDCCDFYDDVWIFDVYGDGKAELIIEFRKVGEIVSAYLYDDVDRDGRVSYVFGAWGVNITESLNPTLKVKAKEDWLIDEKVNFNIEILGDGKVNIGQVYYPRIFKPNDGVTDFKITIYDDENDGDPDYELRENLDRKGWTMLMVDYDDKEAMWKNYIFWPYLGKGPGWWERSHNSASPPILVDWEKARVSTIQLMVSDRYEDGNCFILTPDKILRNKTNELTFENPFCFYDLANDDDGYQEAVLRVVNRPYNRTTVSIRYSWDQDNDGRYDFSIDAGRKPEYKLGDKYVSIIDFRDFSIVSIPFEDGPNWAFDGKWYSVKFTDTNDLYWLGEGVYGHLFNTSVNYTIGNTIVTTTRYVAGRNYHRVEFSRKENNDVTLYLSPIDGKLHLKNADKGTFMIKAKETGNWYGSIFSLKDIKSKNFTVYESIDYENLDDDEYFDKWTYYVNDTFVKSLIYSDDVLIYHDKSKIKLLKNNIKPYVFETVPPKNYEEWKVLGANLEKYKKDFDPQDFEGMFNQFQGEIITIKGGFIRDFDLTEAGFKAFLDCTPQCVVEPSSAIEHDRPLSVGEYVLSYDGKFRIIKSIIPDLVIKELDVSLSKENPREIEYVTISARIHNTGKEDIGPVVVSFFEGKPEKGALIGSKTIPKIQPSKSMTASQQWLAKLGVEEIYVVVDPDNLIPETNKKNNIAAKQIYVFPLQQPSAVERIRIGSSEEVLGVALLLMLAMLFLAFFIAREIFEY
jgi:hypothetical protein